MTGLWHRVLPKKVVSEDIVSISFTFWHVSRRLKLDPCCYFKLGHCFTFWQMFRSRPVSAETQLLCKIETSTHSENGFHFGGSLSGRQIGQTTTGAVAHPTGWQQWRTRDASAATRVTFNKLSHCRSAACCWCAFETKPMGKNGVGECKNAQNTWLKIVENVICLISQFPSLARRLHGH